MLWAGNLNFKLRIVFWNIFFWRFEKQITLSEKKPPLVLARKSCFFFLLARMSRKPITNWLILTENKIPTFDHKMVV